MYMSSRGNNIEGGRARREGGGGKGSKPLPDVVPFFRSPCANGEEGGEKREKKNLEASNPRTKKGKGGRKKTHQSPSLQLVPYRFEKTIEGKKKRGGDQRFGRRGGKKKVKEKERGRLTAPIYILCARRKCRRGKKREEGKSG